MSEISNSDNVIFIISEKFMLSSYCMLEFADFVALAKQTGTLKQYYPIILDDAKALYDTNKLDAIQSIWLSRRDEISKKIKDKEQRNKILRSQIELGVSDWELEDIESEVSSNSDLINHLQKGRKQHNLIIKSIPDLINYFRLANTLTIEVMRENNFADVFWKACGSLKSSGLLSTFKSKEEVIKHMASKKL